MPGDACEPVKQFNSEARLVPDAEVLALFEEARSKLAAVGFQACVDFSCLRLSLSRLARDRPGLRAALDAAATVAGEHVAVGGGSRQIRRGHEVHF